MLATNVRALSHQRREPPVESRADESRDFKKVYALNFHEVARWVRAMGAPHADVLDLTQDVFIIVQRKLPLFDGNNLRGFLYQVTRRTVRDHKRRAWFRKFVLLGDVSSEQSPAPPEQGPSVPLERAERLRELEHILAKMSDKRRTAFVLFEIEGYSGEEIAKLEDVPLKTVWTRLHHARKDFVALVAQRRARGD